MSLEFLERYSGGDGPLHRLDPRIKIIAAFAYVVSVVATPVGAWTPLAVEGVALAAAVALAGVPPPVLARRWLAFLPLVGFLAAVVAPAHPKAATIGALGVALTIVAKNSLAFLAMMVLANVTPMRSLFSGLRRLGVPLVLVGTLHFMARYLYVLSDELDRMVKARRSRSYRRSGRLDWGILSGLIGVLLLRALERGERVHAAMLSRGWDGTIRSLDGIEAKGR